ncbi:MAG: hypothetical protein L0Z48_07080 [candidate division Zixibacteria bacterium]|nr:hypothetical protein [candidate division Zixibacteria bacterium]MCI0596290.1 hypothetical protein [candidate division Zixibacteria bacterium]
MENPIEKEHAVLKAELMREIKALYATLTILTTGQAPEVSDEIENLSAEKLVSLKQRLKQKLDGALAVGPTADVRFKPPGAGAPGLPCKGRKIDD